jgi:hypothetical protein
MSSFLSKIFKPYNHIQIRYNTKMGNDNLAWRVIVDGKEFLAETLEIHGSMYGEESYINDERKFNIACHGRVIWQGRNAYIKAIRRVDYNL